MGGGLDWDPRHGSGRGSFLKRALGTAGGCHPSPLRMRRTPQPPFSRKRRLEKMAQQVLPGATAPIPHSVFGPLGSVSRYLTNERAPDSGHQRCRPVREKRRSEEAGAKQGKKASRGSAEIPRQSWLSRSERSMLLTKSSPKPESE